MDVVGKLKIPAKRKANEPEADADSLLEKIEAMANNEDETKDILSKLKGLVETLELKLEQQPLPIVFKDRYILQKIVLFVSHKDVINLMVTCKQIKRNICENTRKFLQLPGNFAKVDFEIVHNTVGEAFLCRQKDIQESERLLQITPLNHILRSPFRFRRVKIMIGSNSYRMEATNSYARGRTHFDYMKRDLATLRRVAKTFTFECDGDRISDESIIEYNELFLAFRPQALNVRWWYDYGIEISMLNFPSLVDIPEVDLGKTDFRSNRNFTWEMLMNIPCLKGMILKESEILSVIGCWAMQGFRGRSEWCMMNTAAKKPGQRDNYEDILSNYPMRRIDDKGGAIWAIPDDRGNDLLIEIHPSQMYNVVKIYPDVIHLDDDDY